MPKDRQTCTECSMRRQKCDRNIPCGRCVKRGDADKCSREWPGGGYNPKVHRTYPRSSTGAAHSPDGKEHSPTEINNDAEAGIHPSLRTPASTSSSGPSPQVHSLPKPRTQPNTSKHTNTPGPQQTDTPTNNDSDTTAVLDFITWGRPKLSDYDLKALELLKEPHQSGGVADRIKDHVPDWDVANCLGGTGVAQVSFLQMLLPSRRQVYQLVEYHLSSILWYHGCFHGPTLYDELNEAYKTSAGLQIRDSDMRWTGLLFSIMAGSMTCANEQLALSWGFKKGERAKLTRQWYKATVTCLNLSDYMWRHHVYSVEAILTLTMSAHVLGFSNTQSTLLGAALKIAQGLGLQRLGPEDDVNSLTGAAIVTTHPLREKTIKREVGRRLWAQLCIQDWFSIPFSEMYSIQKIHFTTLKPMHCDEHMMQPLSEDVPSMTSFPNFLYSFAELMPQIHDAIVSSNTLYTKYEQVLDYDAKMRTMATEGLPKFFSVSEPISSEWPQFIPWARRGLTICFAHKIIMIHRAFLGRSFTEPAFDFTRRTCMAAAKAILKEAVQAYDEEGPLLWIDQAFMVAAGITLALDTFHRTKSEPEHDEHRKLVENTISMLSKFEFSMIALRGIRLLSSLLAEQARLCADQTLENYRKRTFDSTAGEHGGPKRQKFNVPKFVESFVGNDSFTNSLRTPHRGAEPSLDLHEPYSDALTPAAQDPFITSDLGYETFEQLFPPQTGISNNFLFEDLLNFDI
ncbi:uncharacterized protein A1O9_09700 [Exophiala aquamarina CBS 119918]|uniref:Zn(2)-C6 fungal-type domain-containing protein n=1 Tax=Exophiala aquamarina CBS 119918 TaxID=1182545 RepID=A0A072P5G7_9EURO|nr:uncharacterized protein A1O9_09700 [Exophiala aquamarina CBS 119918]KEF54533.1 hypothetical protein A1O9_09700 [Exophiala aquamarina CBS 119918]